MIPKDFLCFSSISLSEPIIDNKSVKADIELKTIGGKRSFFTLQLTYEYLLERSDLPYLRMACIMPLLNYGLFSERFDLQFPLSTSDKYLIDHLNTIFSRDIFVNKILRRRTKYILPEYFPDEKHITLSDANPRAHIDTPSIVEDSVLSTSIDKNKCGVLSSGGKESLLSYGLLNELGAEVFPFYVNESGGHWRTALAAYSFHKKTDSNTGRVWTNVDRFYNFMLDNLPFIRKDHRKIRADTYPIRLCIFPHYIFALLPVFARHNVGNLLLGSEFDDQRETPMYQGINHYFGVYDQHQDFDNVMNAWYRKRIPSMVQWSALRGISGLIVERILVKRYPELAKLQRSCHSCHLKDGSIIPCGSCTKCMGVMLFLFANHADPRMMNFQQNDIICFPERMKTTKLRLDEDEKNHSLYLAGYHIEGLDDNQNEHVEKIHVHKETGDPLLIPDQFRSPLYEILEEYTKGYCILKDGRWVATTKKTLL